MIRGTWVWDRELGELVPKHEYQRKAPPPARGDYPTPMVSRSQLDSVWNPCDGKRYDTLRNYEKSIPKGNHILESGEEVRNDARPEYRVDEKEVARDISTAWDQLEAGYKTGD